MTLLIHSGASYLSDLHARSIAGGHFFLGSQEFNNTNKSNGAFLTLSNIIKNHMSSATDAEFGAFFHNSKAGEAIRFTLEKMGHPQSAMPMQTRDSTMDGIVNDTIHKNGPKLWICGSIGYKIEFARAITSCFGNREQLIWSTILSNTIRLTIISESDQCISTVQKMQIMQVRGCVIQARTTCEITTLARLK